MDGAYDGSRREIWLDGQNGPIARRPMSHILGPNAMQYASSVFEGEQLLRNGQSYFQKRFREHSELWLRKSQSTSTFEIPLLPSMNRETLRNIENAQGEFGWTDRAYVPRVRMARAAGLNMGGFGGRGTPCGGWPIGQLRNWATKLLATPR